ncbi:hypothetical protein GCM10011608_10830 [Micromonospora sonchi]|uniref:Uncharacterized protein n=1 Tax=Micromonospora sonchi TaxID=1763543 RepID=A0A917TNV9_9ACTN|nr:hypothetical protein [Micromonospora sonchi]GGM27850.1 hypothetical protein GCM10011608_10830 [Micromonospora sonchi]
MTDFDPMDCAFCCVRAGRRMPNGALASCPLHGGPAAADDPHLPAILAAIDNALRNGSHMTGANLAFELLCERLGVDRDRLVFQSGWAATVPDLPAERG